jgi:uncharacterized LabA/DUF88 family protein
MDWARFRRWLQEEYKVSRAYLFIGYLPEYEAMYEQLHELGYLIVLKPTVGALDDDRISEKQRTSPESLRSGAQSSTESHNSSEVPAEIESKKLREDKAASEPAKDQKPAVKGNIDAELVMYAMKEMPNYDKAVIVSGDGDFYCLVEYLAAQNKLLHLMAPNWQYSSLLKPYEQYIIRLDKQRRTLAYRGGRRTKKQT